MPGTCHFHQSLSDGYEYRGHLLHRPPVGQLAAGVFHRSAIYAGRTFAYLGVAFVLVTSALSATQISLYLQKYMNLVLGPIMIVAGMFLLELIRLNMSGPGMNEGLKKWIDAIGIWGAFVLGVIFALSFCPLSAYYYFFNLIPLSLKLQSSVALPLLYGVGTALPVMLFAVLLAISAQSVGKAYNVLAKIEWWARIITGWIFILLGIYFSLKYIFEVI